MKQPYVLVIEDDNWQAEQHERTLIKAGYDAACVANGPAAIDSIDERRPDVIVLDIFLAGPNGFVLLHELRSHSDIGTIPVIVCSGSADTIAEEDLAAYGVTAVLDKATLEPGQLAVAVKKALL